MRHGMQKDLSECQITFYYKKIYLWNINFLGGIQTEAFPLQAQGKKWRWHQKHKPDCEVRLALPSLLKRQPKLDLCVFFWRTLFCGTQPEAFHAPMMFGSLLLPLSSESWLILKDGAVTSAVSAPCPGRPWAAPAAARHCSLCGDMPQIAGDSQGVSTPHCSVSANVKML